MKDVRAKNRKIVLFLLVASVIFAVFITLWWLFA